MADMRMEAEERGKVVKNRDIPLLSDVLCIMQEVYAIEQRRDWQKERMYNITQHLSGMPGAKGKTKGLDDAFSMLSEIDEEHEAKCKEYVRMLRKAQRILNGIGSCSMRTFVIMKYVMDVPDVSIRQELNMSLKGFYRAIRCIEEAESMEMVKWRERYILAKE